MIQPIQVTKVFDKTVEAAKQYKIILHQGSSRSSKTWSIFQFFIEKALKGESFVLTIARSRLTWVRATILKDFQEITDKYNIPVVPEVNVNRAEQVYKILNAEFAFFGLDYPQKLHGRKQDYFWINEGMEVGRKEFDQLEMRTTRGGIIDYNPSDDGHWIFDLSKRPDVTVIISTMLDNPFLEETIKTKIRSYEPNTQNIENGTADSYMWEVYGLGNKAKLQGLIYENWDIQEIPKEANFIGYGLDFGYTNDPTALIAMYMSNNEIYASELIYQKGLTNSDIASKMDELKIDKYTTIWADSSEPKSIEEIRRNGYTIMPVEKGADSINFGISILKDYKVHITPQSINLDNERRKYKWAEDISGKSLNKPVDAFNHGCDALRYGAMMLLKRQDKVAVLPRFL